MSGQAIEYVIVVMHYVLLIHGHFNISTFLEEEASCEAEEHRREINCVVVIEVTYSQSPSGMISTMIHARFYKDNDFACSSNNKYLRRTIPVR